MAFWFYVAPFLFLWVLWGAAYYFFGLTAAIAFLGLLLGGVTGAGIIIAVFVSGFK